MGVVSVSTSSSGIPLGSNSTPSRNLNCQSPVRRPVFLAFKIEKRKNKSFSKKQEPISLGIDSVKDPNPSVKRVYTDSKRVNAVCVDQAPSTLDLDYDEVAAALENLYKLSPKDISDQVAEKCIGRKKITKNDKKKPKRLGLSERIMLMKKKSEGSVGIKEEREEGKRDREKLDRLVRDYSVSTDLVSLDWKKMKIPAVLSSSEHTFLFKLMQPVKATLEVLDTLQKDLGREPTDGELASAINMTVQELRRHLEVGHAARNKLIKHNLRLILFTINKYYHDIANGQKFQDICQAGVKGLITAIDRFEPKRGFRLSTYALFWIRHAIIRSMTISSFARVPFGIESIRQEIQRAKLELSFELMREPTEDEVVARVGISHDRYNDIMKSSKPIISLNGRHATTQEELIKGIADIDSVSGDRKRQPALLRLALDDVLDSLKPKESLVIRQRYGLDGKGDRTLGEIAGNLNISREMVRKHEVKALMKLKHPTRVDYLRRYIV